MQTDRLLYLGKRGAQLREDADEIEGARESPVCFERTAEIAASYGARDKPCLLEAAAAGSVPVTPLCSPASTDGGSDSGANDDDDDDEVCVPVCRRASAARSESFHVDDVEHAPACGIGTFDYCGGFEAFDSGEDLPGPPGSPSSSSASSAARPSKACPGAIPVITVSPPAPGGTQATTRTTAIAARGVRDESCWARLHRHAAAREKERASAERAARERVLADEARVLSEGVHCAGPKSGSSRGGSRSASRSAKSSGCVSARSAGSQKVMSSAMVERVVRNLSTSRRTTERELARKREYYASLEMRECTFAPNAPPSKPEPALAAGVGTRRHKLDGDAAAHRLFLEAKQRARAQAQQAEREKRRERELIEREKRAANPAYAFRVQLRGGSRRM